MNIGEKIKKIRETENYSQWDFAIATGINAGTLRHYESGRRLSVGSTELLKITQHPAFFKYTLWLMTGTTAPEAGQICPDIEEARKRETG